MTGVQTCALPIYPFDEPNVKQAKDATNELLKRHAAEGALPMKRKPRTPLRDAARIDVRDVRVILRGGGFDLALETPREPRGAPGIAVCGRQRGREKLHGHDAPGIPLRRAPDFPGRAGSDAFLQVQVGQSVGIDLLGRGKRVHGGTPHDRTICARNAGRNFPDAPIRRASRALGEEGGDLFGELAADAFGRGDLPDGRATQPRDTAEFFQEDRLAVR